MCIKLLNTTRDLLYIYNKQFINPKQYGNVRDNNYESENRIY